MKIAPVSADLLIKLAIAGLAVGAVVYAINKATGKLTGAADWVTGLPGRALDSVTTTAKEGGAAWQDRTTPNPPTASEYFGKYKDPLVNDAGMDFGQLGG